MYSDADHLLKNLGKQLLRQRAPKLCAKRHIDRSRPQIHRKQWLHRALLGCLIAPAVMPIPSSSGYDPSWTQRKCPCISSSFPLLTPPRTHQPTAIKLLVLLMRQVFRNETRTISHTKETLPSLE